MYLSIAEDLELMKMLVVVANYHYKTLRGCEAFYRLMEEVPEFARPLLRSLVGVEGFGVDEVQILDPVEGGKGGGGKGGGVPRGRKEKIMSNIF